MKTIVLSLVLLLSCASLQAQEPQQQPTPQQVIDSLRVELSKRTAQLAEAYKQLADFTQTRSIVESGSVGNVQGIVQQLIAKVEQGNPGQTLDLQTGKLVAKPEEPKADAKPSGKPKAKPDAAEK